MVLLNNLKKITARFYVIIKSGILLGGKILKYDAYEKILTQKRNSEDN